MQRMRWARLVGVAGCGLRRGAWYPVVALSATEVQLHVRGRVARVPRALLELRDRPPREWTLVPAGTHDAYLVCPNCRARQSLPDTRVPVVRCTRCNDPFAVTWNGLGPAPSSPSVDTLRRDLRMTRRRRSTDRRAGLERRAATRRVAVMVVFVERRLGERRLLDDRRVGLIRRAPLERRRRAAV